jgi:hypothetical protein
MTLSIATAKPGDYLVDDTNTIIAVVEYCSQDRLCTTLDMDDRRWTWHLDRIDPDRGTVPVPTALRDLLRDWHVIPSATLTLVRAA